MPHSAVPFRVALAWVLAAGLAAQAVGILTSAWAHATVGDASPGLLVPALFASAGTLFLVVFLAPALAGVPVARALGLRGASPRGFVAAASGTVMLGPTGDFLMTLANDLFPEATLGTVPALNDAAAAVPIVLAWPAFALLPGTSEELLFRGLLQQAAPRGARAIAASGVLFALFHVDPHHVVGVLPLGLFLAWVAERSGAAVTAVAHVANNTAALLLAQSDVLQVGYATPHAMPWTWVPASLLVVAFAAGIVARATDARPRPA